MLRFIKKLLRWKTGFLNKYQATWQMWDKFRRSLKPGLSSSGYWTCQESTCYALIFFTLRNIFPYNWWEYWLILGWRSVLTQTIPEVCNLFHGRFQWNYRIVRVFFSGRRREHRWSCQIQMHRYPGQPQQSAHERIPIRVSWWGRITSRIQWQWVRLAVRQWRLCVYRYGVKSHSERLTRHLFC